MLVICEECGKKYQIDPARIQGDKATFKCQRCTHLVTVMKPQETGGYSAPEPEVSQTAPRPQATTGDTGIQYSGKSRLFGLKGKMATLFLVLPILIIAASGALYLMQFRSLSNLHTKEGAKVISQMAKYRIIEKSRAVAGQCRVYLEGHPWISKKYFESDADLKNLAINKIGQTGETFLYSIFEPGEPPKIWLHSNEGYHGVTVDEAMKNSLGRGVEHKKFMKIWKYPEEGKNLESAGFFLMKDNKGNLREQYIFLAPIGETNFGIAGATYLDEFTKPIKVMEARAAMSSVKVRKTIIGIVVGTLLLFGAIVSLYGYRLTERIKSLTELADRISIGELDTKIDMKTGDEIEDLAKAISRMQASIRLSIGRLRRNR